MQGAINKLFDHIYQIPSVPEVVSRLVQNLGLPEVNFDEIARHVGRDQAIAMKVLRLVNSAYFGLSRKLTAINEAVLTLGSERLTTIIIASGMIAAVPQLRGFDLKAFWMNSLRRATYAKAIAHLVPGCAPNTAFTCGLIADFGRILVQMGAPAAAERIDAEVANGGHRQIVERSHLGYTSAEVGAELCRRWNFPEILQRGVAQSAEPMAFADFEMLAAVVHIADALCELKAKKTPADALAVQLPAMVVGALALDETALQLIADRIYESEEELEALAA